MGSFFIEARDWGLHIRLQGELSIERRDDLARQMEYWCAAFALQGRSWSSLIEFDHFEADGFRPGRVVELMRLARTCGHQRSAIVLTDWRWASPLADAMIAAGTDDQVRIFMQPDGFASPCESALDWTLRGGAAAPSASRAA